MCFAASQTVERTGCLVDKVQSRFEMQVKTLTHSGNYFHVQLWNSSAERFLCPLIRQRQGMSALPDITTIGAGRNW
jgi:hypothetical protein